MMGSNSVKTGLIQMTCSTDKQTNIDKAAGNIRIAAGQGARIICLQELFASSYFCREENYDFFSLAETIPGPTIVLFGNLARPLHII